MGVIFFKEKKPGKDVAVAPFPYAPTAERESSPELKYRRDAQHQVRHSEGLRAFGSSKPVKIDSILKICI